MPKYENVEYHPVCQPRFYTCTGGTFDLLVFKVILGLFDALVLSKNSSNAFLECYNGYILANWDAPSHCTAINCLLLFRHIEVFSVKPVNMILLA